MPTMCMPVLFKEISEDLGLSLVQVGAVWGIGSLTGIFTGLVGGSLGDRYGVRRTLTVICLLAGMAGALRGFATDFVTLSATILVFGLLTPAIPMNVHKVCGVWFDRQQLGLANGVVSAGMALGFVAASMISATVLSPALGGWRHVLFLYGVISAGMSLPWALSRSAPGERGASTSDAGAVSIPQALSHVIRIRNVWFLGFALMGVSGCVQGVLGYLSLHLQNIGWPAASADGALAAFHTVSLISAIPITLLSDRLSSRKTIIVTAVSMIIAGAALLSVASGPAVWAAVIIAGAFRDGFMAVFMTTVIESEGVGAAYAGTAIGLVMVFSGLGALISPPLGNSLSQISLSAPFVFWAAIAAVASWTFRFVKWPSREPLPQMGHT
ncbi:MAG: MFS transporter [Anaerolineae bacterium]|nr:MFS transporter [Anaerolineae bacterium]